MKPSIVSLVCAVILPLAAAAVALTPLTVEEKKQIEGAELAARRSPAMKGATAKFSAARNLYRADRAKFPAERDKDVAIQFRKATKEYADATRQAVLAQHPELVPLFARADAEAKAPKRKTNEGETLADSDSLKNPAVRPIKDKPGLPRVLLIGDSVSIGYTLQVRERLQGKANVHRIPMNGGATEVGLENLRSWLGEGKWDVIHFNFGLHDAKFASETTQRASREQYAENLRQLIAQMKAHSHSVKLIFATTTPVPKDGILTPTRKFDSIPARNEIAVQVMKENGGAIDDLYSVVLPVRDNVGRENDVHFQPEGYEILAKAVAASIEAQLPRKQAATQSTGPLFESDFRKTPYGRIPDGWRDLIEERPSRNWAVDGNAFLRPMLKLHTGLIVLDTPTADGQPAHDLADARLVAEFKKTEDEAVSFGIAGRVIDREHFYLARFTGTERLELLKVKDGRESPLDFVQPATDSPARPTGMVALRRYREGERWKLSLTLAGNRLTALVSDAEGHEQARLEAIDGDYPRGHPGLRCTTFAAASSFGIDSLAPFTPIASSATRTSALPDYPIVRPHWQTGELNTPNEKLAAYYDVIVAGAGTGGWAAAVQAARMGARVLLLEETDWIGGQMCAAAVTTMDEDSVWMKFPVRERGIYREFHESMVTYYQTLDKDPFVAYYSYPEQAEGGYEPKAARAMLYGFIEEVRGRGAVLDVSPRSRVVAVQKARDTVTGATIEFAGAPRREIACRVLIDATEYGDVMPLTGARYRVGNGTSDGIDPAALVQDHTWTCVLREYPNGIPEHLQIKSPPPGYETGSGRRFRKYTNDGVMLWGAAGKGFKGHRHWRVYFAWRGMADADSPLTGLRSSARHTQCGFNGGNDYPVTAATIEDPAQRRRDEREGIYRTLGALYYFQQELGVNWSLAEDEGYATPANRAKMHSLDLRPDLEALAVYLPQQPYVRECRRLIGLQTLTAKDLGRFENARHATTSVAMGDYFMDLEHGRTSHAIEPDLDAGEPPKGGGPFQVPFEVFIPEKIDGFLPAEKNLSQSRLANGATRLQPITMLTGQAAGAIAALAVREGVQPRQLDPMHIQAALLESGCTLIQRWYADVPWGTPLWRATQLLALYRVMDRPGDIERDNHVPLAAHAQWGAKAPLTGEAAHTALDRLAELKSRGKTPPTASRTVSADELTAMLRSIDPKWCACLHADEIADGKKITEGEFAVIASRVLLLSK